jgi:hypothetical protein
MNSVSSSCYNPADKFSMMQANWAYQSAQIAKAEIAGEQSTDIQIQTADGDKVTLSSDITFESSAIVYEKQGQTSTRYRQSQGQIVSATASSTLELTVEGTLDEQEKKEIKAVLMNLFKMVKDSGAEPSKILNRLDRRLAKFSGNFMHAGPAGWHKMRMIQAIMEDFARKLRKLSAENDAGINKELGDAEEAANTDDYPVVETTSSFTETKLNAASQDFHFEMEYSVADDK